MFEANLVQPRPGQMPMLWVFTRWDAVNSYVEQYYNDVYRCSPGGQVQCHECGADMWRERVAAVATHHFHHDNDEMLIHFICEQCSPNRYRAAALAKAWIARLIEIGTVGMAIQYEWLQRKVTKLKGEHPVYVWPDAPAEPVPDRD